MVFVWGCPVVLLVHGFNCSLWWGSVSGLVWGGQPERGCFSLELGGETVEFLLELSLVFGVEVCFHEEFSDG